MKSNLKEKNRKKFFRYARQILKNEKDIEEFEKFIDILRCRCVPENVDEEEVRNEFIEKLEEDIEAMKKENEEIAKKDEIGYIAKNLIYLRRLKKEFEKGFVFLPSLKERIEDVKSCVFRGRIPFLYGEKGVGKTEFAKVMAKKISGKEPEFFSATERTIYEELLGTQSRIYEALKEGKIVVIDEANRIPPRILYSLGPDFDEIWNMERKRKLKIRLTGEEVDLEKIDGFPGFILTYDLVRIEKNKYNISTLDPWFRDRVKMKKYEAPNQETDPSKEYKDKDVDRDLYLLGMIALMDKHNKINAPPDVFEKVWRLAQAFKFFQNAFAGRERLEVPVKGGGKVELRMHENNASINIFLDILKSWKDDGFKYKIDAYIFKELIQHAKVKSVEAGAFYTVLKDIYGFFPSSDGWPELAIEGKMESFPIKNRKVKNEYKPEKFNYIAIINNLLGKETP